MLSGHGTIVSPVVCVFVCVCAVLVCGVFCVSVGSAKMNLFMSSLYSTLFNSQNILFTCLLSFFYRIHMHCMK